MLPFYQARIKKKVWSLLKSLRSVKNSHIANIKIYFIDAKLVNLLRMLKWTQDRAVAKGLLAPQLCTQLGTPEDASAQPSSPSSPLSSSSSSSNYVTVAGLHL